MIEIISVDDHEMISLGLERVFSQTKDIRVCHFCKTKAELVPFIESKSPEELKNMLAMLDIKLEEGSGFEVADFLLEKGVKCLMYSSFSNAGYVIKTMEHKITGFITKNAQQPEILEAVHAVFSGETYIQKNLLPDMMFVSGILVTPHQKRAGTGRFNERASFQRRTGPAPCSLQAHHRKLRLPHFRQV